MLKTIDKRVVLCQTRKRGDYIMTISSVADYIQEISKLNPNSDNQTIDFSPNNFNLELSYYYNKIIQDNNKIQNRSERKLFYRGHYSTQYLLLPSVFREKYGKKGGEKEDYFYHEIMVQCPQYFQYTSHLDKLVTMQHYDCPTRLLDITSNPLVALFFACKNFSCQKCESTEFGKVLVFAVSPNDVVYSDSDRALLLSCLPRFSYAEKKELYKIATASISSDKFTQKKGGSSYVDNIVERFYHEISTETPSFKREIKPIDILKPLFVQPNKTNGRILKQDGAFIISGLSKDSREAEDKLNTLVYKTIIIKNQKGILQELNRLGINEATLFPEVDKVAEYLKGQCV